MSAYASGHPWEDWAETWAHYLHMVDTLETAHDFGYSIKGRKVMQPSAVLKNAMQHAYDPAARNATFDTLLDDWVKLTVAMNSLNRSMGLPDAYPFVLLSEAAEKLRFVHRLIRESVNRG